MKNKMLLYHVIKKILLFSIIPIILSSCYIPETPSNLEYAYDMFGMDFYAHKEIYLAHNIWVQNPSHISALNFQEGKIIPFGTQVVFLKAEKGYLIFKTKDSAQQYKIINDRAMTLLSDKELFHQIFTQEGDPILKFKDVSPAILSDMKKGVVTLGMTRDEVLTTYGNPPKYINQLSDITWVYLINSQLKTTHVVFQNDKVNFIFGN